MKRILNAIIIYISFTVFGTLFGALFCMLCMNVTNLVVGTKLALFSAPLFIKGLFLSFPLASTIALLLLVLHHIRHRYHSALLVVVYVLLNALSWLVLIPQTLRLSLAYDMRMGVAKTVVSPGYFREDDGLVYYWSKLGIDGTGEGLCIDLYGIHGRSGAVYPQHQAEVQKKQTQSIYADALVDSAIKTPHIVRSPLGIYTQLLYQARDAASRTYGAWLLFAAMGVAMLSVYALSWLSEWRLLNAFLVTLTGVGIVFLNHALYESTWAQALARRWALTVGKLSDYLPFATCVNIVLAMLILLVGVCAFFAKSRAVLYMKPKRGA